LLIFNATAGQQHEKAIVRLLLIDLTLSINHPCISSALYLYVII
jgi:hypothetical protein